MKSKHAISKITGMSVWQKIFCVLMAVVLLSLMVPNGLRANAATDQTGKEVNSAQKSQDEILKDFEQALNADVASNQDTASAGFMTLNSKLSFIPNSVNAAETAGHFTSQKAGISLVEYLALNPGRWILPSTEQEFYDLLFGSEDGGYGPQPKPYSIDPDPLLPTIASWLRGMLSGCDQADVYGNFEEDLSNALYIPEDIFNSDNGAHFNTRELNTIIFSNGLVPYDANSALPDVKRVQDGSLFYLTITLGEGNVMQMIENTTINLTRLVPIIPATYDFGPMERGLLGAENSANASTQAYFLNYDVSLDGVNYIPLLWLDEMLGLEGTIKLLPYMDLYFKANFFDMENMTLVHLDFSGATVTSGNVFIGNDIFRVDGLGNRLMENGWYTTDPVHRSIWTKAYPNWMPTWLVIGAIFEEYGELIFDPDISLNDSAKKLFGIGAYKDEILVMNWALHKKRLLEENSNAVGEAVFPGPHWCSIDNENLFGNLEQETTITFSMYPVSPRGHVVHNQPYKSSSSLASLFDVPRSVYDADVMYYDKWGFPLFWNQGYGYLIESGRLDNTAYYFFTNDKVDPIGSSEGDWPAYSLDWDDYAWCFDTQIDHAVVFAHGYNLSRQPQVYIPLRVEAKDFDSAAAGLYDYDYADFQVERMMFGDIEVPWTNDNVASYDVTFFEDGQQLFDTYTIDNPWEMAMFALPLVTNGTICTGGDRLVSGWNAYVDWFGPFGDVNPLNAFQDENNFKASEDGMHFFQVQLQAHPKPGCTFDHWYYDHAPISADTYAGEEAIIIHEPVFFDHTVRANYVAPAAAINENAEVEAIDANVSLASDTPVIAANPNNEGSAQTGDNVSLACAILAMIALAGAGVFAGRRIYTK